jgi:hypothetical protein
MAERGVSMKKKREKCTGKIYIDSSGCLGLASHAGRRAARSTPRLEGADLRE